MEKEEVGLTDEDIEEFRTIWKDEFKEELTMDEARYHANRLMELYLLLAGFKAN